MHLTGYKSVNYKVYSAKLLKNKDYYYKNDDINEYLER